uniref:Uncharacterized protein n=1 Tax=Tanacetum cinerariifolium TaxID=118510 RepID=A0A699HLK2_TANCI|nr:hypothetical protein [Tanacetum cinerariifolium]
MYTFSPMMVANSRKHHCRVRPYTREVLIFSTNLEIQTKHYVLVFRNHRGDEARIKKTWEMVQLAIREHKLELGMSMQVKGNQSSVLTMKKSFSFDPDVDAYIVDHPVRDLALNDDNIFQPDECDAFDPDTQRAQLALYDGNELLKTHHVSVLVPSSEEDLELAENIIIKMNEKMNDHKADDLKDRTPPLPVLPLATVYPPNTPVHLVPRILPTTSQVNIGLYVITQLFWDFEKTCKKKITPTRITKRERGFEQTKRCYLIEVILFFNLLKEHFDGVQNSLVTEVRATKTVFENFEVEVDQNAIDLKSCEIERKDLLITNENLIANCIALDVVFTVTDSAMTTS